MGAAIPVIGLAISAAGTAAGVASQMSGGGTIYTADSKAKYKADLEALKMAEYSAAQKEKLIQAERQSAQEFAKFAHEQDIMNLNAASESAAMELEQQWQQVNFDRSISKQTKQVEKFMSDASLENSRQTAQTQYENTKRQLGISSLANKMDLQYSEQSRGLKGLALQNQQLGQELEGAGINLSQDNANFQNQVERQNIGLAENKLGLQGAQLDQQTLEAQQGLDAQSNQLDLTGQANKQSAFEQGQKLDSAEAQNNAQLNLSLAQADEGKRKQLNQLLMTFAGNEQDYAKYQAGLNAAGLQSGGSAQYDMNNNMQTQMAQNEALSGASNAKASAGIQAQFAQGGITQGRNSLQAQTGLNKQALDLQRSQLAQGQSNLKTNEALGKANLSQEQQALNMKKGNLDYSKTLSDQQYNLQRQQLNLSKQDTLFAKYQLDMDREYDVFSKGLLPDLKNQAVLDEANQQRVNSLFGINLQQYGENYGRQTQDMVEDRQYGMDRQAYETGKKEIPKNYDYQRKAADSAYLSSMGSSNTQMEAALSRLASSQYGTLSSIGNNLPNGVYTGQGQSGASRVAGALGSIGGFMGSLQGYLGSRNRG